MRVSQRIYYITLGNITLWILKPCGVLETFDQDNWDWVLHFRVAVYYHKDPDLAPGVILLSFDHFWMRLFLQLSAQITDRYHSEDFKPC